MAIPRGNNDPDAPSTRVRRLTREEVVASPDGRRARAAHSRAGASRTAGRCRAGVLLPGEASGHRGDAADRQPPAPR
jgi:hypothetical protein